MLSSRPAAAPPCRNRRGALKPESRTPNRTLVTKNAMTVPRAERTRAENAAPAEAGPAHVPADNVLAAIHVVSNRISRAFYADIEARHGISLPEWRVMLTLARHPGMAAMAVAALWGMDKMAISRA